jgi:hypothetical protein
MLFIGGLQKISPCCGAEREIQFISIRKALGLNSLGAVKIIWEEIITLKWKRPI